jgi:7-carboxy-7-deazaguanine synthase
VSYAVKEMFLSLQGEGANSGKTAVFCRFSGCNLWSGREDERSTARCRFCDTDFLGTDGVGGGLFSNKEDLVASALALWPEGQKDRLVVCTGGEPLLQLDGPLIKAFHDAGFYVAVETNGTIARPDGVDWLCVSPKAACDLVLLSGDELKLVYPQENIDPATFEALDFRHFFLQPLDDAGAGLAENTGLALSYCRDHPKWRLGLQIHKILGVR